MHRWRRLLCTPPPGTGLDIETLYLVHVCTYVPHICVALRGTPSPLGVPLPCYSCLSMAVLGNFWWAHFGRSVSEACHLICQHYIVKWHCDVICDVTAPHVYWSCVTFYYKRATKASVGVLACCSSVRQVRLYHQRPACGWCLTRVGRDMSSSSPGWSLLPLTVIIVLALLIAPCPQWGPLSISTRPGSAALLPVSTTSTALLHLLVCARVHRVRNDTGKCHIWPLPCAHHFQCVAIIGISGWAPTEAA